MAFSGDFVVAGHSLVIGTNGSSGSPPSPTGWRQPAQTLMAASGDIVLAWKGPQGSDPVKHKGVSGSTIASHNSGGANDLGLFVGPGLVVPVAIVLFLGKNDFGVAGTGNIVTITAAMGSLMDYAHARAPGAIVIVFGEPYSGDAAPDGPAHNALVDQANAAYQALVAARPWARFNRGLMGYYGSDPSGVKWHLNGPDYTTAATTQIYPDFRANFGLPSLNRPSAISRRFNMRRPMRG